MCGPSLPTSGGDAEVQQTKWLKPSLREPNFLASGEMVTVGVTCPDKGGILLMGSSSFVLGLVC